VKLDVGQPVLLPPGSGEVVGDSSDRRVEILSDDETLNATWSRFGPHREGADLHIHRLHSDLFYVLEGELTVRLGLEDASVVVPAGTLARVPPLVVHGFRNGSDVEMRYLNLHAPGQRFADYLRAVRDGRSFSYDQYPPPADGGRPPSDAVVGGDGFVADRPGQRAALLADVDEIGISETWSDPDGLSPPAHVHRRHVESFYVLEGEMTFTAGGRELHAVAGSWVQIPPGVPHAFAFTGSEQVHFLNLHTPSCSYGSFLRGLLEARTDEELAAVRAAFDQVAA
jgi:mannose-6-phosphate isomerase-like protein (cupin superfamily)